MGWVEGLSGRGGGRGGGHDDATTTTMTTDDDDDDDDNNDDDYDDDYDDDDDDDDDDDGDGRKTARTRDGRAFGRRVSVIARGERAEGVLTYQGAHTI